MCNNSNYSRLVQRCLLYIKSDYMYIAGVEDIAFAFDISKSHLIREFSKQVGISPNKYLIKHKLEHSKYLLTNDQLSIDAVAQAIGFSGGNYFSKCFKKEYGMTPTDFILSSPIVKPTSPNNKIYL